MNGKIMDRVLKVVLVCLVAGRCVAFLPLGKFHRPGSREFVSVELSAAEPTCPVHPEPVPLPSPLPDSIQKAFQTIENQINNEVNTTSIPGITASVVYRDEVVFSKGFGVKDKSKPGAPDGSTIFRIGSVSKVFAVLVLYQMYERGMVKSLDDPLSNYCQGFSIRNPYGSSNITLRQMAAQMSGLRREAPCSTSNLKADINTCPVQTKDVIQQLKNDSLIFPPWSVPSYSNLAFALIGRCLVEFFYTDMTYEQYVEKYILSPLNMTNTGFNITANVQSHMAVGYNVDGSVAPLYDLGWLGPAGQMFSTTDDLNKLAQFFYVAADHSMNRSSMDDTVLSPVLRREMELPVYVNRDQLTGFGTPWEIRFESNYTILRKGGNVGGYSALFSYIPNLQLGVNVLFSGGVDEFSLSNEVYATIIPAFVTALQPLKPRYPYPPDPQVYEGTYMLAQLSTLKIVTYEQQLLLTISSQGAATQSVYLAYKEPLQLQIDYPDNVLPCLQEELVASRHQYVYFEPKNEAGVSPGLSIPGLVPGIHFVRAQ